jgi:hypothetical protein
VETREREARLEELFAAGWTTELFAEFCFDSAEFKQLVGT